MSRADLLYRETCARILREGVWDTDQSVRPRWADGSPAHTVKCFGVVNRYDLQEEFPLMTHTLTLPSALPRCWSGVTIMPPP